MVNIPNILCDDVIFVKECQQSPWVSNRQFYSEIFNKKKNYQKLFFLRLCVLEESNGEIVNCENNTTADNNNSDEANNPDVNNVNKLRLVYYKFIRINKYLKKAWRYNSRNVKITKTKK